MAYHKEGNRSSKMNSFGAGSEIGGYLQSAKSTLGDGYSATQPDKTGVQFGLSDLQRMDTTEGGLQETMGRNPFTGNPISRVERNPEIVSASSKGKSFQIC